MPRRTVDVTITAEGRDKGKVFLLTELPADEAEEWATKAIFALANNGVEIPDEVMENPSLAGIAYVGTRALGKIDPAQAIPLFREMMKCVEIYPDPSNKETKRALVNGAGADIEEIQTRLQLRMEVISLHLGFSLLGAIKEMRGKLAAEATMRTSGRTKTRRRR